MTTELLHIDCMEYMQGCLDDAFDLAVVDPPYGIGQHGAGVASRWVKQRNGVISTIPGGFKKKDWDNSPPNDNYFNELFRVSKNQIIWGMNHFRLPPSGVIVWDKVNDGSYQNSCDLAFCSINRRVDIVRYMWRGMMQGVSVKNGTVQQGNKKLNEKRIHPTQKPIKLYRWILENYAKPSQSILDTHLGSGSSAIAAHYYGVDFVGCEIDEDYYNAACKRFYDETKQLAMF